MAKSGYILLKLVEVGVIFFVILTALFFLFRLSPGDPISKMVDPMLTPEDMAHLIQQMGLDRPMWEQYLIYVKNFSPVISACPFITGNRWQPSLRTN